MRGKAHLISGAVAGAAAAYITFGGSTVGASALIAASCVGSLLPDVDLPTSTAGKILKPISLVISKMFGHRTITHAPLWIVPLAVVCFCAERLFPGISDENMIVLKNAVLGYLVGFVCHLIGDFLTVGGIPALYPFSKHRMHLTPIESGKHDIVLTLITILLSFVLLYFAQKYVFGA